LDGTTPEPVIVKFFGIFFLFFQTSLVWGNLISSWGESISNNQGGATEKHIGTFYGTIMGPSVYTKSTEKYKFQAHFFALD
jgi:hypothetical protein